MAVRQGRREIISFEGLRQDGRRALEVRHVEIQFEAQPLFCQGGGLVGRPDSSVLYQQGETLVLAVVRGPREPGKRQPSGAAGSQRAQIVVDYSQASLCRPGLPRSVGQQPGLGWVTAAERREWQTNALLLQRTFEDAILSHLYPRTEIFIGVHVLRSDGGSLACAVNACSLALAQAGVPMKDLVVACSAGFIDDVCVMDCNLSESSKSIPMVRVAVQPRSGKIAMSQLDSRLPLDQLEKLTKVAMAGCLHINKQLRKALRTHAESKLLQLQQQQQ